MLLVSWGCSALCVNIFVEAVAMGCTASSANRRDDDLGSRKKNCIYSAMRVRLRESSLHAPPPGCRRESFTQPYCRKETFSRARILTNRHDNAHAAPTAKAEDLDDAAAPSSALPLCNGANGCYPARRRRRLSASPFTR